MNDGIKIVLCKASKANFEVFSSSLISDLFYSKFKEKYSSPDK